MNVTLAILKRSNGVVVMIDAFHASGPVLMRYLQWILVYESTLSVGS